MTPDLERAIKAANGYVEQRKVGCRYCEYVRIRGDGIPYGGKAFFCGIAGKLGEMPVNPDAICNGFEEKK